MSTVDSTHVQELSLDGNLVRSDRSLRWAILIIILLGIALQLGIKTLPGFVLAILAVALLARSAIRGVHAFAEPIRLTIRQRGIELRRGNGVRLWAEWRLFDRARIERLPSIASHVLNDRWRLSLENAFKPSIGSFVDSKAMDRTIFYFPVLIDFEATPDAVELIETTLNRSIEIAARAPKIPPRRKASVQPLDPLQLRECIVCDYPLEGLPRTSHCPECGWQFEQKMFLLNGRTLSSISTLGLVMITIAAVILLSCLANVFLPSPNYAIAGLILVAAAYVWMLFTVLTSGRGRVLATGNGLEVWRNGVACQLLSWRQISELRQARVEQGLRIGVWLTPKWRIWFSALLGRWRSLPPSRPDVDVTVAGSYDSTEQVWQELQGRWRQANPNGPQSDRDQPSIMRSSSRRIAASS